MSGMSQRLQDGFINKLLLPLVVMVLLFFSVGGFALWSYVGREDYKNNVDAKIAVAVAAAKQQTQATDAATYAEEAKSPLKTWTGPSQYGSLKVQYPKTWSGYVVQSSTSQAVVDGYFYPDVVPSVSDQSVSFALRIQVVNQAYDQAVAGFQPQVKSGALTAHPFVPAKVPSVTGTRLDGQISTNQQGSIVIMPVRNLTIEIWTESNDYLNDFSNTILPNITFAP